MFKNYITIAWRNLLKHKVFSFINISGLAIGIAACMLIFLYVRHETGYDLYNSKADRIGRVTMTIHTPESDVVIATTSAPFAPTLLRDYPEVEAATRLDNEPQILKYKGEFIREEKFYNAEASVFKIFDFDFIEGNAAGSLDKPNSVVISENIAKKYFGDAPAIGQRLTTNQEDLMVTGVFKNRPANSDLNIEAMRSEDYSKVLRWTDDFDIYTFILFKNMPKDLEAFDKKISVLGEKYIVPEFQADGRYKVELETEILSDVHFSEDKLADTPKGNRQILTIFSTLAIFILIIAILNYINLSTAKSAERAREVGIRKVSGAAKWQLVRQFLAESFFLIFISWVIALGLVAWGLPYINSLFQTNIEFSWKEGLIFSGGLLLITMLLSGIYPAFVLSGFQPILVLKGSWKNSTRGIVLRKAITITQFAIAAVLILGTTIIYSQMSFIRNKDLGLNKDQLLQVYMPDDSTDWKSVHAFQQALRQLPQINNVTVGARMTIEGLSLASVVTNSQGKTREVMCNFYQIDQHYLDVFQIKLLEGRNLTDSFGTDKKNNFLVNEAFVKSMGWETAIGKDVEGMDQKGKIVGVVKDFYYKSLHNMVEPLAMIYNKNPAYNTATIRMNPGDLPVIKKLYQQYFPTIPFNYSFFDEMIGKYYERDQVTLSLFNKFSMLAILVSCLGLYGLVSLITIQRTKEIGVRKVLGASLQQLVILMTGDFMRLVLIALLIALPVGGFLMFKWLSDYAYHTELQWWMFAIPIVVTAGVAIAVISREIIKTAMANPVKSLRSE